MKLRPNERSAILAGEHPQIVRKDKEGDVGQEIVLRSLSSHNGPVPQVWITIIGYDKLKTGAWSHVYSVRDDRSLYLARGSGYTRSGSKSVDPEASVEDPATLKRYAAQGRLSLAERKEASEEAQKAQDRAARSELTETLSGLDAVARLQLLADLQRLCKHAKDGSLVEAA